MDSTLAATSSELSTTKITKPPSKRIHFIGSTHRRQNFDFPDSLMHYISKNPISPKVYQKLVKTCKYFFFKNPILIISSMRFYGGKKWKTSMGELPLDMTNLSCKLWVTNELYFGAKQQNVVSEYWMMQNFSVKLEEQILFTTFTIPKLYRSDIRYLTLTDQIISYDDLLQLIPCVKRIYFDRVIVKNGDGSIVPFEKIVEVAVNAKTIIAQPTLTSFTMKELVKLPHFSNLHVLAFNFLREDFDLESFYTYMKKNKQTKLWLRFDNSISENYKNRIEEIIDEIISTEFLDFRPPSIYFFGLNFGKHRKLERTVMYH